MTPQEFFDSFVRGNYEDYLDRPGSVRRAFNAAVSATHLADHYFTYYKKYDPSKISDLATLKNFLSHLESIDINFNYIRSIANAYKHLYPISERSAISSTGAIESISFDENSEVTEVAEELQKDSSETKVIFTTKDGHQMDFLPALKSVIDYWKNSGPL